MIDNKIVDRLKKLCENVVKSFAEKSNEMFPIGCNSRYIEQMKVYNKEGGYTYVQNIAVVRMVANRSFEIEQFMDDASVLSDIENSLKDRGSITRKNNKILCLYLPSISQGEIEKLKKEVNQLAESFKQNIRNHRRDILNEIGGNTGKKVSDEVFQVKQNIEKECKKYEDQIEDQKAAFIKRLEKI